MGRIITPGRFQTTPKVPMRVNWGHPLARNLIEAGYILPNGRPWSAASFERQSLVGTATIEGASHGVAAHVNGTGNYIDLGRIIVASTDSGGAASALVRTRIESLAANSILLATDSVTSTNYSGHWLDVGVFGSGVFSGNYGKNLGGTGSAQRRSAASATGVISAGKEYSIGFVCRAAADWSLYLDGASLTPSYSGSSSVYNHSGLQNGTINFRNAATLYGDQSAVYWFFYDGSLSDGEMLSLYEAPFQILAPISRRIWVPGAAGGAVNLSPSLFIDGDTFHAATVSPGAVTLTPSLYVDADTFYSATVAPGLVTLTPALVTDADTFYAPTVSQSGAPQSLTPALYVDGDTFFAPTVAPGAAALTPALYADADTFYAATVAPGAVTLLPSLYADPDAFYSPTVSADGATQTLTPSLFVDGDTFHAATVAPGAVSITPALYADADAFYAPTVAGLYELTPTLLINGAVFYSATVASGAASLTPVMYVDADAFYSATVSGGTLSEPPGYAALTDQGYGAALTNTGASAA